MTHTQESAVRAGTGLPLLEAQPPAWVSMLAGSTPVTIATPGRVAHPELGDLRAASADGVTHLSVAVPNAAGLSAPALEAAVAAAYHALAAAFADASCQAVRFWNFIPGIHAAMGDGRDRYMVFNAGRFGAFASCYGSPAEFSRALPTASAVGVREGPLVVHGLGLREPGIPLENPRQIPAYSYSRRYGPRPPCFARATLVRQRPDVRPWLLVGGTASIFGEDSMHVRDVRRQAYETFENLARLVASARDGVHVPRDGAAGSGGGEAPSGEAPSADHDVDSEQIRERLAAFRELRVYIVREEDADTLRTLVRHYFPSLTHVEYAQADLCRQELLVEIEGRAQI